MGASRPHDLDGATAEQIELGALRTFFRRPMIADIEALAARRPDVAVIGAPYDLGVTNRPGARFGPHGVRTAAYYSGSYHLSFGIEIFDWLDVVDAGDVWCPHGQPERCHANIRSRVAEVAALGIVPVIIGGDHSVTAPVGSALASVHGRGRIGMIHFDAHADTANEIEGNLAGHGTPMRRLVESGDVSPRNFVQIGLRSHWPGEDVWDWMADQGMRWHLMDEVCERGLPAVVDTAIAEALDGCDRIYLTIDIDCLDPAFAPGTGTPEPGGLVLADLIRAVRQIARRCELVAMDVVEVSPPYDHSDLTVNAAHHLVVEALAALAAKKRAAAGGTPGRPGTSI